MIFGKMFRHLRNEIGQINKLVEAGLYLNPSDLIRDAVGEKLAAIKIVEYRDVDYETAKKEVAGYFQMKGKAFASDASTDLQLDYELVCKIVDELELEGKMEIYADSCAGEIQGSG